MRGLMHKSTQLRRKNQLAVCLLTGLMILLGTASFWVHATPVETKANLKTMIENAKTANDHHAIAAYYSSQAEQAKAKVAEHQEMAKWYRSWRQINKSTIPYKNPEHCERLAKSYNEQAVDYAALAKEHEIIASDLEKNAK